MQKERAERERGRELGWVVEGRSRRHGGPAALFSDSLFCNCPNGLLSSAEFQKSYETGPELDVQRLTHSGTVCFRGRERAHTHTPSKHTHRRRQEDVTEEV